MLDQFRDALRALSDRLAPEEQRRITSSMRDALVHAKMGLADLREGILVTERRLVEEQRELETVRRRAAMAQQAGHAETVEIAEKFAAQHAERVAVLESKRMVQQQELSLNEREYEEMTAQLRMAMSGLASGGPSVDTIAERELDAFLAGAPLADDLGSVAPPRRTRADKEADAESRLAELKRRMGK